MAVHHLEHPCHAVVSSRRGASHNRDGSDRQDRVQVVDLGGDLLIAMADGVGSAARSAVAADLAVRVAVQVIREFCGAPDGLLPADDGTVTDRGEFRTTRGIRPDGAPCPGGQDWRAVLTAALVAARHLVLREAAAAGDDRHAWATTLAVVVVTDEVVHAGQIGDGFVVLWNEDPDQSLVLAHRSAPDSLPDVVTAITSSAAPLELTYGTAPFGPQAHLLVSTDGIAPVLLDRWLPPRPSPRFLAGLARELASGRLDPAGLDTLLDSDLICSRSDDDKSVVLVRRHALGSALPPPEPVPVATTTTEGRHRKEPDQAEVSAVPADRRG